MSQMDIRIRELEASLDAHRLLLASVSTRAEEARGQLLRIGHELGGEEFTNYLASLGDPENISADKIATQIMIMIQAKLPFQNVEAVKDQIKELRKLFTDMKRLLDVQTKRASSAETSVLDLRRQVETLENNLANERRKNKDLAAKIPPPAEPTPPVDHSEWFSEWSQHKSFERNKWLILLLGEYGLSRLTEIKAKLIQGSDIKPRTVYTDIKACVLAGLIERRKGVSDLGRPTAIILLTEKGKWTYSRLTGRKPVPSEYLELIKAHKTNRHTNLILSVADHFQRVGFTVDREPRTIQVPGGHIFQPDLIIQKETETFYLEVETGEQIERASLAQKWQNAMVAGGGRICIAVPRPGVMTTLQSHVQDWGTERGKKPRLYLTNLEWLRNCKPGDSPWARIR